MIYPSADGHRAIYWLLLFVLLPLGKMKMNISIILHYTNLVRRRVTLNY